MLAAILNNELKRSVIVESSSCGDLSDGSDLASARNSFCGDHGAATRRETRPTRREMLGKQDNFESYSSS